MAPSTSKGLEKVRRKAVGSPKSFPTILLPRCGSWELDLQEREEGVSELGGTQGRVKRWAPDGKRWKNGAFACGIFRPWAFSHPVSSHSWVARPGNG